MGKQIIHTSEKCDKALDKIKAIGAINGIDLSSREKQIEFAASLADTIISHLEAESFESLTGYKKQWD